MSKIDFLCRTSLDNERVTPDFQTFHNLKENAENYGITLNCTFGKEKMISIFHVLSQFNGLVSNFTHNCTNLRYFLHNAKMLILICGCCTSWVLERMKTAQNQLFDGRRKLRSFDDLYFYKQYVLKQFKAN